MPKLFRIKDEDGKEYKVEETEVEKAVETEDADEVTLSSEEIEVVKKLLPHVDKIIEFVNKMSNDVVEDEDKDEEIDEDEEEIIDTDEDTSKGMSDAIRSAGKIERKTRTDDSIDIQDEISSAWSKRYGGKA